MGELFVGSLTLFWSRFAFDKFEFVVAKSHQMIAVPYCCISHMLTVDPVSKRHFRIFPLSVIVIVFWDFPGLVAENFKLVWHWVLGCLCTHIHMSRLWYNDSSIPILFRPLLDVIDRIIVWFGTWECELGTDISDINFEDGLVKIIVCTGFIGLFGK